MAAKAYFQQANAAGISVHSHLTEVIHRLITSKDENALKEFENISLEVKKAHFTAEEPGVKNIVPPPAPTDDAWKKSANALFKVPTSGDAAVPNLLEDAALFEWAGVGVTEEDAYRLFLAMTKLKAAESLKSVRFFGKILGTSKDYYIVEAELTTLPAPAPTPEGAVPAEPPGTGLNKYAYFVTNDVVEPFTLLPDVTPAQVVAATLIKKYFTGSLTAAVRAYPPFPGDEAAFLRAQIARIYAATVLAPAGKFTPDPEVEEAPPLIVDPEFEAKPAAEMADVEQWLHLVPKILKIGRLTNPKKEGEGEEGEEEVEVEEEGAALEGISGDPNMSAEEIPEVSEIGGPGSDLPAWSITPWSIKLYGSRNAAVAIAKSKLWPGAYAASKGSKFASIYVGYGFSAASPGLSIGTSFTPEPPPMILGEAADVIEQDEVTLEAENELLKAIEEAKMAAEAEGEEGGEE